MLAEPCGWRAAGASPRQRARQVRRAAALLAVSATARGVCGTTFYARRAAHSMLATMNWMRDLVLGQLQRPHGWLAPLMGRILDRANRRLNAQVIDMLDPRPDERILEIGFGGGAGLSLLHARCPEARLAGVEISTAMLAGARRRFRRALAAQTLELHEASVERLPWPDDSFDGAYTINTIYFWPDAKDGLRELLRVLRPWGRLILGVEAQATLQRAGFADKGFLTPSYDDIATWLGRAGYRQIRMLEDRSRHMAAIFAERPPASSEPALEPAAR
jgi:arsenite methyltransferase